MSDKTISCVSERIYECILGLFVKKVRRSMFREVAVVVLGGDYTSYSGSSNLYLMSL